MNERRMGLSSGTLPDTRRTPTTGRVWSCLVARLILLWASLCLGCSSNAGVGGPGGAPGDLPSARATDGAFPMVRVVVRPDAPPETLEAAAELVHTLSVVTGVEFLPPQTELGTVERIVIGVGTGTLDAHPAIATGLTGQSYRIQSVADGRRWFVSLTAGSPTALLYATTDLCQRLGARYLHPERTVYAADPALSLPLPLDLFERPALARRGLYFETRQATPFADMLMRPASDLGPALDRLLLWLVRNRLNVLQFDLLDTVPLADWVSAIGPVLNRAQGLGIRLWPVVSLDDDRRHSLRLVEPSEAAPEAQLQTQLDTLLTAPLDRVVVRWGASPLVFSSAEQRLSWLLTAQQHLVDTAPEARLQLMVGDPAGGEPLLDAAALPTGLGLQFRRPLLPVASAANAPPQSPPSSAVIAAQASGRNTIYTLDLAAAEGAQLDLPLPLPTLIDDRGQALSALLPETPLLGAIGALPALEWGGALHALAAARLFWEGHGSLPALLDTLKPAIGPIYADALQTWATQLHDFSQATSGRGLSYLMGERPVDELGGLLSPPRHPLRAPLVALLSADSGAAASLDGDLVALEALEAAQQALLGGIAPPEVPKATDDSPALQVRRQLDARLRLGLDRTRQTVAMYRAVSAIRQPLDDEAAQEDRLDAHEKRAHEMTQAAGDTIQAAEALYAYPAWLLWGERLPADAEQPIPPVTTASRGWLDNTHKNLFFKRREQELGKVVDGLRRGVAWDKAPEQVFSLSASGIQLAEPDSALAAALVARLVPNLLVGVHRWDQSGETAVDVSIAWDRDGDGRPDTGAPQQRISNGVYVPADNRATLSAQRLVWRWADWSGTERARIELSPVTLTLEPKHIGGALQEVLTGELTATLPSAALVETVQALAGADLDAPLARALVAQAWALADTPLPETLPVRFLLVGFTAQEGL